MNVILIIFLFHLKFLSYILPNIYLPIIILYMDKFKIIKTYTNYIVANQIKYIKTFHFPGKIFIQLNTIKKK